MEVKLPPVDMMMSVDQIDKVKKSLLDAELCTAFDSDSNHKWGAVHKPQNRILSDKRKERNQKYCRIPQRRGREEHKASVQTTCLHREKKLVTCDKKERQIGSVTKKITVSHEDARADNSSLRSPRPLKASGYLLILLNCCGLLLWVAWVEIIAVNH